MNRRWNFIYKSGHHFCLCNHQRNRWRFVSDDNEGDGEREKALLFFFKSVTFSPLLQPTIFWKLCLLPSSCRVEKLFSVQPKSEPLCYGSSRFVSVLSNFNLKNWADPASESLWYFQPTKMDTVQNLKCIAL